MAEHGLWLTGMDVPPVRGVHPFAELYQPMTPEERLTLNADLMANGQREPAVVMPDGRLLDGVHRRDECQKIGVALWTVKFLGSDGTASEADALAYVHTKNSRGGI